MSKSLQIVSFDVPYPANYGGVIDVFYKLKALKKLDVDITLHTFEYGRGEQNLLEQFCSKVYYYPRNSFRNSFFCLKPFIVKTRENKLLISRLKKIGGVILYEGLHTTAPLLNTEMYSFKNIVRAHNIEHHYYKGLFKSEHNYINKIFFAIEAIKLKYYEQNLNKANHILSISPSEQVYFKTKFGPKSLYIPVFTDTEFSTLSEENQIVLWHGDLRVSDNVKSVLFAINVVRNTSFKLVIASSRKNKKVTDACKGLQNVTLDELLEPEALNNLLAKAKVNLLFTYQATGVKLKLLNALTKSRFVLTNDLMVKNTGLEDACVVANSKTKVRETLGRLMNQEFTEFNRLERKNLLKNFDTRYNAQKIIDLMD